MAITDYISIDTLAAEGFIHSSDTDAVMAAVFGSVPKMIDRRLEVPEIARWLGVSLPRFRRYVTDRHAAELPVLSPDGRLSIRQIISMDWSQLTGQKRTARISVSHFQGRKRKPQKHTNL